MEFKRVGRMALGAAGRRQVLPYYSGLDDDANVPDTHFFTDLGRELRHHNIASRTAERSLRDVLPASVEQPLSGGRTVIVVGANPNNPWANKRVAVFVSD